MWTLGIETSGLDGSVALARDAEVIAERRMDAQGRRHAQTLLSEIRALLQTAGIVPAEVDAVAVSLGPGSFTGLRVGVVAAKTWAYAAGCRVVGLDTHAAIAAAAPMPLRQLWVIGDAQRGDFFATEFRRGEADAWQPGAPVAIVAGEPWLAARRAEECVAGPGVLRITGGSTPATVARDEWSTRPSAAAIALLGFHRVQLGQSDDPWTLAPIYIRPSAAEEKRALSPAERGASAP
jgi:tRNA threonylcarbamoyladenosine biosynthesis protein TsaB